MISEILRIPVRSNDDRTSQSWQACHGTFGTDRSAAAEGSVTIAARSHDRISMNHTAVARKHTVLDCRAHQKPTCGSMRGIS